MSAKNVDRHNRFRSITAYCRTSFMSICRKQALTDSAVESVEVPLKT